MASDLPQLVEVLSHGGVDFVVIGGLALVLRGGSRVTDDLDICYAREPSNLERLADALRPFHPTLRGAAPDLPFLWDAQTLQSGLNFTLTSDLGSIDLFGEVAGVGSYAAIVADAEAMNLAGVRVAVMSLDALERSKRAAGRAKDLLDLAEIAEIRLRSRL